MNFRLLTYNVGIDSIPFQKQSSNESEFKRITYKSIQDKDRIPDTCYNTPFINHFNKHVTTMLKAYIETNKIEICALQEVCQREIDQYEFISYIKSPYRSKYGVEKKDKYMVIGLRTESLYIGVPLYKEESEIIKIKSKFESETKMEVDYPSDSIQTAVITPELSLEAKRLYLINIHNRSFNSHLLLTKFIYQLMGTILNICKEDGGASNIIICGDNNKSRLVDETKVDPRVLRQKGDDWKKTIGTIIQTFISKIESYDKDIIRTSNTDTIEDNEKFAETMLYILLKLLKFDHCYQKPACDITEISRETKYCRLDGVGLLYFVYDVIYSRMEPAIHLEVVKSDICGFRMSTSGHIPYVVGVTVGNTDQKFFDEDIEKLFKIAHKLIIIGSNRQEKIQKEQVYYAASSSLTYDQLVNPPREPITQSTTSYVRPYTSSENRPDKRPRIDYQAPGPMYQAPGPMYQTPHGLTVYPAPGPMYQPLGQMYQPLGPMYQPLGPMYQNPYGWSGYPPPGFQNLGYTIYPAQPPQPDYYRKYFKYKMKYLQAKNLIHSD